LGVDLGIVDLYATSSELERCQTVLGREALDAIAGAREWHGQWWRV
jgi:hypothetical protein